MQHARRQDGIRPTCVELNDNETSEVWDVSINKRLKEINLRHYDFWILMSVLALLSIGLIMIFSASAPSSVSKYEGDAYYIFRNQLWNALLGILGMLALSFVPYRLWSKLSGLLLLGAAALLVAVLVPGVATSANGSTRQIYIGPANFQPSEIAKFAIICFLAASLAKHRDRLRSLFKGLVPYLLLVAAIVGLLMAEPHVSASIIILTVSVLMLFAAGAKLWHFIVLGAPIAAAGYFCIYNLTYFEYARMRIETFLGDPWADPLRTGWQIIQSLYAIGTGGLFGRGIGKGMQKFLYLSEPQNDFIFSVLAEEMGFVGVILVLLLFGIFIWRGVKVSMMAGDMFGSLLAIGVTSLIAVQSLFNIAVVTAILLVTGVSLPFFSYGGTSMILFLGEVGVLLNISKSAHVDTILPADDIQAAQFWRKAPIERLLGLRRP
jgi:cell division protein FtsW